MSWCTFLPRGRIHSSSLLLLLLHATTPGTVLGDQPIPVEAEKTDRQQEHAFEFSGRVRWHSGGKTSHAQLFVKHDRYRIEHRGGVRTDLGYAGVSIVRVDKQEVWYILSQRRKVLVVPIRPDHLLYFSTHLEGEISRSLIGDSVAADRPAQLFDVLVEHHGRRERYYEWVDAEEGLMLKLLSQDRDWSVSYEHVVFSAQPDYYFEVPRGYQRVEAQEQPSEAG